jgi:hypothetical protein
MKVSWFKCAECAGGSIPCYFAYYGHIDEDDIPDRCPYSEPNDVDAKWVLSSAPETKEPRNG